MKRKPGDVLKSWFLFGDRVGPLKDFANLTLTRETGRTASFGAHRDHVRSVSSVGFGLLAVRLGQGGMGLA